MGDYDPITALHRPYKLPSSRPIGVNLSINPSGSTRNGHVDLSNVVSVHANKRQRVSETGYVYRDGETTGFEDDGSDCLPFIQTRPHVAGVSTSAAQHLSTTGLSTGGHVKTAAFTPLGVKARANNAADPSQGSDVTKLCYSVRIVRLSIHVRMLTASRPC